MHCDEQVAMAAKRMEMERWDQERTEETAGELEEHEEHEEAQHALEAQGVRAEAQEAQRAQGAPVLQAVALQEVEQEAHQAPHLPPNSARAQPENE